ncbi:DUF2459 domain-containing protein [Erythrobacter sp. HL-111]|uniref:DUF2459 domain-containing protein n=1 Tax=Erythrobacter sp. HL-111 TaxID=1798193 RepID=UPI0006DA2097|nr:DUF2459 domain-containing protein [Erythrobacter sp. HL-111]KPP96527.1 MAG: Protein of unknown function (DUF2459) [Erythrobacteraceae bacterium HL-111]SDS06170.1 conserved hypothetical protein [Erythrobacter sp. HL-111]
MAARGGASPLRRWLLRAALALVALPVLYAAAAWIGSSIPRNGDWEQPDTGVTIMVADNGVHTEIVMPIRAEGHDWRAHFQPGDIAAAARRYTHVAVSWGERNFFLETPTWADLELDNALGALAGGEALLHVAWYVRPAPSEDFRELRVSAQQYRALAGAIAADLTSDPQVFPGYERHDVFYSARGLYHLGYTCNQWTSDRLAGAGIETGWWTPFAGGVMKWVPGERRRIR